MSKYHLISDYQPTGDQPEAIRQLTEGLERGDKAQVLLGVTGSGKTFTMANVMANVNKPTLILSGSKIGVANKWSKSIAIVANITRYAFRRRPLPNAIAITPGANKCNE